MQEKESCELFLPQAGDDTWTYGRLQLTKWGQLGKLELTTWVKVTEGYRNSMVHVLEAGMSKSLLRLVVASGGFRTRMAREHHRTVISSTPISVSLDASRATDQRLASNRRLDGCLGEINWLGGQAGELRLTSRQMHRGTLTPINQ